MGLKLIFLIVARAPHLAPVLGDAPSGPQYGGRWAALYRNRASHS